MFKNTNGILKYDTLFVLWESIRFLIKTPPPPASELTSALSQAAQVQVGWYEGLEGERTDLLPYDLQGPYI